MAKSFFPTSDAELSAWAANYKNKIVTKGPELGMTQEQIDAEVKLCDQIIDAIADLDNKKAMAKAALGTRNTVVNTKGKILKTNIARHKTAENYTTGIGNDLRIISPTSDVDLSTYKPKLKAEHFGNNVRIKFVKKGVEGINLYRQKKGATDWDFVSRVTKSPFDQGITLENPGQPEHWNYQALGVVNDHEVGLPSDIVEIIFG